MPKLIFIYSAASGVLANIPGAIKKALGRSSDCALCNITHGVAKAKPAWADFVASLPIPPLIYHRDEVPSDIQIFLDKNSVTLPVVLEQADNTFKVFVTSDQLANCQGSAEALIKLLKQQAAV